MTADYSDQSQVLLVRAHVNLVALPLRHVVETMRTPPVTIVVNAPSFVCGVSIIRGMPVPVVDLGCLLDGDLQAPGRMAITLRIDDRLVALAADTVLGVRTLDLSRVQDVPPLLRESNPDVIRSIGVLDSQLLTVLAAARILVEDVSERQEAA